jgi:hypothetical protein
MLPIAPVITKNKEANSAYPIDQYLELTLLSLSSALKEAEARGRPNRTIRKLKRRMALCNAYLALIRSCMPVIRKYHAEPLYIINRFWQAYLTWDNLMRGRLPSVSDFYTWYFDSNNIMDE